MFDKESVMKTRDTARLSSKFQISIPKAIRTARRWQAGQVFAFIPKGEGMLLVPVPKVDELSGDRKSTRLNSSHIQKSRMPSSA